MKKVLKWIGIVFGSLLGLLLIALTGFALYAHLSFKTQHKNIGALPITADVSTEGIARGEYLVNTLMACADCHGEEFGIYPLSGRVEYAEMGPVSASIAFPNITPHFETGLGAWTDAEIARAIREGVDKDGVELVMMPSGNYGVLSDADVAAIVGYLRSMEPVHNELPNFDANIFGKMMIVSGVIPFPEKGNPLSGPVSAPTEGTLAYGEYLVMLAGCRDCHGADYSGAPLVGGGPGEPGSPSIAANSYAASWTEEEFIQTFRTGITPVNRPIDPGKMPMKAYANLSENDLKAIYMYFQSLWTNTDN
jgi:mono/diheme cytochrome c family protein